MVWITLKWRESRDRDVIESGFRHSYPNILFAIDSYTRSQHVESMPIGQIRFGLRKLSAFRFEKIVVIFTYLQGHLFITIQ